MSECCTQGIKWEGEPKGIEITIGNHKAYLAKPIDSQYKAAILFLPDMFGWEFVNNRILADKFAQETGLPVLLPDLFGGEKVVIKDGFKKSSSFFESIKRTASIIISLPTLLPFISRHNLQVVSNRITEIIEGFRNEYSVSNLISFGYCFGGRYSIVLANQGKVLAYAAAHPSALVLPQECESIDCPGIICNAESDPLLSKGDRKSMSLIKQVIYSEYKGTTHGFACRSDPDDVVASAAKDDCFLKFSNFANDISSKL